MGLVPFLVQWRVWIWGRLCLPEGDEGSPQGHASDNPRTHKGERTDSQDGRHKIQTGMCGALVPLVVLPCPLSLPLHRSPLQVGSGLVVRVPPPGCLLSEQPGPAKRRAWLVEEEGLGVLYLCQHWQGRVGELMRVWLLCVGIY